jgi:hypothetical protein
MTYARIIDPVDGKPCWYWKHTDNSPREVTWHGPFSSEEAAQADAARY